MSSDRRLNQSGLIPSGNRGLTTRSSALVRRGLEALRSQRERIIRFPLDRSMGWLEVRDHSSLSVYDWENFGDSQGDIRVPKGKQLSLQVSNDAATDLSPLAALQPDDLWELWLTQCDIGDAGLVHLQKLTGLRSLDLADTDVSDVGLVYVQALTELQWLRLWYTKVSDAGLAHLRKLTRLQVLLIGSTNISDAGLEYLSKMSSLRHLEFDNTQVSDAGLVYIKKLTGLMKLSLSGTQISDAGLIYLQELTGLQELRLSDKLFSETQVSDAGVMNLQRVLPNCRIFYRGTTIRSS